MYLKFLLSQGFENTAITRIHGYISSSLGCTMIVQHKQHERMLELFCPRFLFEVIVHASSIWLWAWHQSLVLWYHCFMLAMFGESLLPCLSPKAQMLSGINASESDENVSSVTYWGSLNCITSAMIAVVAVKHWCFQDYFECVAIAKKLCLVFSWIILVKWVCGVNFIGYGCRQGNFS